MLLPGNISWTIYDDIYEKSSIKYLRFIPVIYSEIPFNINLHVHIKLSIMLFLVICCVQYAICCL